MPNSFQLRELALRKERTGPYARRTISDLRIHKRRIIMNRTGLIVALAALLGGLCSPAHVSAAARVEEEKVGPLGTGMSYGISPRGVRLATIAAQGSRQVVIIDGVSSPAYDQVLGVDGATYFGAGSGLANPGLFPVAFSPDGTRTAYAARVGNEYLVMVDGKEIARGPFNNNAKLFGYFPLAFSPKGKHVVWMTSAADFSGFVLHVDGKPGPKLGHNAIEIAFNADESRYAYVSKSPADRATDILVVDGKVAPYVGRDPQFFLEGGGLVTVAQVPGKMSVLVDGKSVLDAATIASVRVPATGRKLAVIAGKTASAGPAGQQLFLDGKSGGRHGGCATGLPQPGWQTARGAMPDQGQLPGDGHRWGERFGVLGRRRNLACPLLLARLRHLHVRGLQCRAGVCGDQWQGVAGLSVGRGQTRRLAPRRSRGLPRHGSARPGCDRGGWRRVSRAPRRV
jgi:hypothetical protein